MKDAEKAGRKAVLMQVTRDDNSRFVALPINQGCYLAADVPRAPPARGTVKSFDGVVRRARLYSSQARRSGS